MAINIFSLKKEIINKVLPIDTSEIDWCSLIAYKADMYEVSVPINFENERKSASCKVWSNAIAKALEQHKNVFFPFLGEPIYLDKPIMLSSNCHIKADPRQTIALLPGTDTCLLRNTNILIGRNHEVTLHEPDENISVEGGIWTTLSFTSEITNRNENMGLCKEQNTMGHAAFLFSNVMKLNIKNVTFQSCKCHGVQISNCDNFICENIRFINHHRDGVHLNGPIINGIIKSIFGENMGDDMVALNGWDWYHTVLSFGKIENVLIEDIYAENNEIRLLPGRKRFSDGQFVDCDIERCIFDNISGISIFKMYCQPNSERASENDYSETVGNIKEVYFNNVTFDTTNYKGFAAEIESGLFHICANCNDIHFRNIRVNSPIKEIEEKPITLVKVGPLSFTHRVTDIRENWIEAFVPDAICTASSIHFQNIWFGEERISTETNQLIMGAKQKLNPNYPNTTPKGGTGYGTIQNIAIL